MYVGKVPMYHFDPLLIRSRMFLGLIRQKIAMMLKNLPDVMMQFLRRSLWPDLPEKWLISRKNLAKERLRNCDVRQVLCITAISYSFKPKNVCIFSKFSSFQLFRSEIILLKCCKEVSVPLELVFSRIFRV